MKSYALHILLICIWGITHAQISQSQLTIPHSDKPILNDPAEFQFLIVADRTGGLRPGVFADAIDRINLMRPEFIMSVGDLIEGYTDNSQLIEQQWHEFDSIVNRADMRFYYLAGNHDLTNQTMGDIWRDRLGKEYYHFTYENVLFLCLNSEDGYRGAGKPYIGQEQFDYFKEVIKDHSSTDWIFVFTHQPLWIHEDTGYWQAIEKLLADKKHTVFAGHTHQYSHYARNNTDYIVLGTTGGVSKLRGEAFGEIDHVTWVSFTPQGPLVSNITLDGILTKDFATSKSLEYFEKIAESDPIYIKPLFYDDLQEVESMTIIAKNDFDLPLSYEAEILGHPQLLSSQNQFSDLIGPRVTKQTTVPIKYLNEQTSISSEPLIVDIEGKVNGLDQQSNQWNSKIKFWPIKKEYIEESNKTITVDGDLSEWKTLRYLANGDANSGFEFDIVKIDSGVVIGIDVHDPKLFFGAPGKGFTDTEGLMISIDVNDVEKSSLNKGKYTALLRGEWTVLGVNPQKRIGILSDQDRLIKQGINGAYKITKSGYSAEITLNNHFLESKQGQSWNTIRLNIRLNDKIAEDEMNHISWKTDWWSNSILGSGTFFFER